MQGRKEAPLVSILVLCYNNQKYIYENLRSIFDQTYPHMEVLIADDASDSFDAGSMINWINKYRTENIAKISVYENPENIGTVASLENLQKHSSGEYLFNIAADDVLYDKYVIERFFDRAVEIGEDAELLVAQTEMWDNALQRKLGDFLEEKDISFIQGSTPQQIFAECSWHPFLPASCFYRRSLLEKIGSLAEKYVLIEDWPTQLIATRKGIQPYFVDMPSCIKHRDGGISHGNSLQSKTTFLKFYRDLISVYANEVEPYKQRISEDEYARAQRYNQGRVRAYYSIHVPAYRESLDAKASEVKEAANCETEKRRADLSLRERLAHWWQMGGRGKVKKYAYRLSRKKVVLVTAAVAILAAVIALLCGTDHPAASGIAMVIACLAIAADVMEVGVNLALRYRRKKVWGRR